MPSGQLLLELLAAMATVARAGLLRRTQGHRLFPDPNPGYRLQADFFTEDAAKMEALPIYPVKAPTPRPIITALPEWACGRSCTWMCGPEKACNQDCEANCAPPTCKTVCGRSPKACETRCAEPQCAVVCPASECTINSAAGLDACPQCKTVCSPPICTTKCGEDCKNFCEEPQCSWKCHKPTCPQPECKMVCSDDRPCQDSLRPESSSIPPPYPGQTMVGITKGKASLDPAVLTAPVPIPEWDETAKGATASPKKASARGARERPPAALPPQPAPAPVGPVGALKLRWAAEDARQAKEAERSGHRILEWRAERKEGEGGGGEGSGAGGGGGLSRESLRGAKDD